jgi:hypothetical protein
VLAAWLLPGIGGLLTGGLLVGGGFCVPCSSLYMAANWRRTIRVIWRPAHHRLCDWAIDWPVTSALSTWLTHRLEPALGLAGIALFVGGALSGTVRLKGNSNCNNYRREYWIMCAASRTMSAYFCHNEGKDATPAGEKNVITQ